MIIGSKSAVGKTEFIRETRSESKGIGKEEILILGRLVKDEARKIDASVWRRRIIGRSDSRVVNVAPGEPVGFRGIVIDSNQPLGSVVGGR